jgi:uncharacterized protein
MEDNLIELITDNLFSELPNIAELQKIIRYKLKLESDEANSLIYKVVAKLNAALFPPIDGIELVLTEGCNLACSYCFEKNMLGHKKMPLSIAVKATDLLFNYSDDQKELNITYFGGEPILNYSVIKSITEYAQQKALSQEKSINFNMTTNGILLTSSMIDFFHHNKIKILLSMDGIKRTHDKFRIDKNGKGTFDRVYENLRLLKEKQSWIGIKMTIMPTESQNLFSDIVELYNLGVNQFIIGPATGVNWLDKNIDIFLSEMKKLYEWYISHSGSDLRIAEFEEIKNESRFGCYAGRTNISVGIDGQISPCSKILAIDSTNLVSKLGDVHYGLINLRNRSNLINCSELRSECEKMGISEDYEGGCYASNYYETQNLFHPSMHDYKFDKAKRSMLSKSITNINYQKDDKIDAEDNTHQEDHCEKGKDILLQTQF